MTGFNTVNPQRVFLLRNNYSVPYYYITMFVAKSFSFTPYRCVS